MATKSMDLGQVMGTSAYQEAQTGGYTGTQAEFQAQLAAIANKAETFVVTFSDPVEGSGEDGMLGVLTCTADHTAAEIIQAANAGKIVIGVLITPTLTIYFKLTVAGRSFATFASFASGAAYYAKVEGNSVTIVGLESAFLTSEVIPSAPGDAAVGNSNLAARADHVHPKEVSDTDRATWNGKASKPTVTTVTLTAAGWDTTTKKQTVTVPGVLADTSKQVIWVTQTTEAAIDAYLEAGIVPVAQAANAVILRADTVPTADITVNIVMQEVGA